MINQRFLNSFKAGIIPAILLCLVSVTGMQNSQAAEARAEANAKFIGDWALVSFVRFPDSGGPVDMKYSGRLRYDEVGYMMGLGMPRDLPLEAQGSTERVTGGFAYWGKFTVDAENGRVIHHVEGSPGAAQWVGQDNIRFFEFDGDLLHLSLKDSSGRITATLTWRRQ
jgi:hypothetical protein